MIIDKFVTIKPNNHSIHHYLSKGYDAKCRKELSVKTEDLSPSSNIKIKVKCDICKEEKIIKYQDYRKNSKGEHFCQKCNIERIKNIKEEKYGDKYYNNREKYKKTMIEKYGSEYVLQCKELKEKIYKTNLERYQVEIISKNEEIKNKIKKSINENFSDYDKKISIINKRINTNIKKYGVSNYTKTKNYKIKNEKTCLEKYGYNHNGSVPRLIKKRIDSRILNGSIKPDNEKTDFYKYKRSVLNITRKHLKTLFENWDGHDYYNNEQISENLTLNYTNKEYPTVDHKISIFYGYTNNIEPSLIGDISNLCITKKYINSTKKDKLISPL